jgi:hypothetical protein
MSVNTHQLFCLSVGLMALFSGGSASSQRYQVGHAVGGAIGGTTGTVLGNTAVAVTDTGKGVVGGVVAPYNSPQYVVRKWRVEITPDGRTISVPVDIVVDANGRPLNPPQQPARGK